MEEHRLAMTMTILGDVICRLERYSCTMSLRTKRSGVRQSHSPQWEIASAEKHRLAMTGLGKVFFKQIIPFRIHFLNQVNLFLT